MTVEANVPLEAYSCTGSTTYAYDFKIFEEADLTVVYDDGSSSSTLVLDTDYSVTGAGDSDGGTVVTNTAYTTGTLTIRRILDVTQETVLPANGPLPSSSIEEALDRVVMLMQQFDVDISFGGALLDAAEYAEDAEDAMDAAVVAQAAAETARDEAVAAGVITWGTAVTANTTATANQGMPVNTSSAAVTITTPTAAAGAKFAIADYNRTFGTNNCTLTSTEPIEGESEDFIFDVDGSGGEFVYIDATIGWKLI